MLIGYTRVSQADGSQSLDLQRDALRAEGVDAGNVARPVNRSALDLNRADHHAATTTATKSPNGQPIGPPSA